MNTRTVGVLIVLSFVACEDLLIEHFLKKCPINSCKPHIEGAAAVGVLRYPKCCPLHSRYDLEQHRCVQTARFPFQPPKELLVETALSTCTVNHDLIDSTSRLLLDYQVIVDYKNVEVGMEENKTLVLNGSIRTTYGNYCFDRGYLSGESVVRVCQNAEETCRLSFEGSGRPCLRKCCPDGQSFFNGNICVKTYNSGICLNNSRRFRNIQDTNFGIIQNDSPPIYLALDEHEFYLNQWGELHVKENYYWHSYPSTKAKYCIETVRSGNVSQQHFFLYEKDSYKDLMSLVHMQNVGLLLSLVFLGLTVFVHLLLPKLRNLHGKCVVMYCINSAMFALSILLYPTSFNTTVYIVRCFIILFLVNGLSAWLSVLSFDIWNTFRTTKSCRVNLKDKRRRENVKFVYYNLFGWGVPALWTVFVFAIYYTHCLPAAVKQSLHSANRNGCFFRIRTDRFGYIFYVVPFLISTSANIIYLALTVTRWCNTKNEISRLKECSLKECIQKKKSMARTWDRLTTTSKLLFMTGVLRAGDIISLEVDSTSDPIMFYLRAIWVVIGSSSGFFIFAIYVLKLKVLALLKERLELVVAEIRK